LLNFRSITADEFNVEEPATNKLPIPAPPATCKAPEAVEDEPFVAVVIISSDSK
jgi:hypothetical protein